METKNADLSSLKINRSSNENYESSGGSKKLLKSIVYLLAALILIIAGYFGYNSLFSSTIEVKLTTVVFRSPSESNAVLTASGYVVAQRKAAVASKGTGRLVYLGVVEGDKVRKDQIIARLEDNDIKAQLEQARANLRVTEADLKDSERNFNRQKELLKANASTQQELDAAESRYLRVLATIEVAKAQVTAAEVALENMLIRAPFDGTVLTKNADVGEIVAPFAASASSKAAVVLLADMSSLQVEADVSESNIERIKLNQNCEIVLDAYPDKHYPGFVAKVVPTADRSKATVMVKIGFRDYDNRVLPEMSAKVLFLNAADKKINVEEKSVLVVPSTSVVNIDGRTFVYVVRNDMIEELTISTGRNFGGFTEIKSGLNQGDRIVESIPEKLKAGVKVKVN
ncbi:MAG: efflux RND transporter periplasmic adaptor subunit [Ignavibacteriales bacterium]|nr:efflux RND transporter periplasmic adaptor subunit [Ignavibacteriales bacterium]